MVEGVDLPNELVPHIPRGIAEVLVALALVALGVVLYREFATHIHPGDIATLYGGGFAVAFAGMLIAGVPVSYAVAWALLAAVVLTAAAIGELHHPHEEL